MHWALRPRRLSPLRITNKSPDHQQVSGVGALPYGLSDEAHSAHVSPGDHKGGYSWT